MVLQKFEENLIQLSVNNTWESASKEWGFTHKMESDTKDNHCLCGYKLKHQYYYYNKMTNKIICCGNGCKKHIDNHIGTIKYDNDFVGDLLYILGKDRIVDYDLYEYCANNEQKVFDRMMWRIDNGIIGTAEGLDSYYEYVKKYWSDLIDVDIILINIKTKIKAIFDKEERLEKERLEKERLQKERLEKEEQSRKETLRKHFNFDDDEDEEERMLKLLYAMDKEQPKIKSSDNKLTDLKDELDELKQLNECSHRSVNRERRIWLLEKEIERLTPSLINLADICPPKMLE